MGVWSADCSQLLNLGFRLVLPVLLATILQYTILYDGKLCCKKHYTATKDQSVHSFHTGQVPMVVIVVITVTQLIAITIHSSNMLKHAHMEIHI